MKQVRYDGATGRYHGRRGPSGRSYQFRRDRWVDVPDEGDAAYFEDQVSLEVRTKPTTQSAQEAAEGAVSGFLAAVRKAGEVAGLLDSMDYDTKHEAADDLDLDVPGNASHEELNEALQTEVDRLTDNGELDQ